MCLCCLILRQILTKTSFARRKKFELEHVVPRPARHNVRPHSTHPQSTTPISPPNPPHYDLNLPLRNIQKRIWDRVSQPILVKATAKPRMGVTIELTTTSCWIWNATHQRKSKSLIAIILVFFLLTDLLQYQKSLSKESFGTAS
jgi:hypothetical protein